MSRLSSLVPAWSAAGHSGAAAVRQTEAVVALVDLALPSDQGEAWRYSGIGDFRPEAFLSAPPPSKPDEPSVLHEPDWRTLLSGDGPPSCVVELLDGRVVGLHRDPGAKASGLRVTDALADDSSGVSNDWASDLADIALPDAFATFALAAGPSSLVIDIPRGVVLGGPVLVIHRGHAVGTASGAHITIRAGADSEATVVEVYGDTGSDAFCAVLTEVQVDQAARVRLVQIQDRPDTTQQIGSLRVRVERDATFELFHAATGSARARHRTDCVLAGRGATGNMTALYFGGRDQTLDFRTFQRHDAPDTTSNLRFTGAVDDHARSVYSGLIRIEKNARGSNAFQTNRNLKLSPDAWADSVPNLEIENNDVRCSHATTVSPVDIDQLFYLGSRGVPPEVAERLIVEGFFADVLGTFPFPGLRSWLSARVAQRLDETGK